MGEGDFLKGVEETLAAEGHVTVALRELPSEGKLQGIAEEKVEELAQRADCVIVEADGSKGRPLKAPAPHEPVVPRSTTLFVIVTGADGLGKPLGPDWVFRPEIVSRIVGLKEGEKMEPRAVAKLILEPEGLMKGRPPGARAVLFVNKVDGPREREFGLGLAEALGRDLPFRIVLGRAFFLKAVVEVLSGGLNRKGGKGWSKGEEEVKG